MIICKTCGATARTFNTTCNAPLNVVCDGFNYIDAERIKITDRLLEYYRTPDEINDWLELPHPQLPDEMSAADAIIAGMFKEVNQIIDRLDSSAYL